VDDLKRGRVMSFFTMAFTGTMPLGNLAMGSLAAGLGTASALLASGGVCVLAAYLFHRRVPKLREAARPVLERLNVIETQG
jgi:hypothetical protein